MGNKRSRSNSGSLAGWLFADLAIVLAIAFLQSSIGSGDAPGDDPTTGTDVNTTTTIVQDPTPDPIGVAIKPCKVKFLRVTNIKNDNEIKLNLIFEMNKQFLTKINQQTQCSPDNFFGVILVFAGNLDTNDDDAARARADSLCESLFLTWIDAVNIESTYCEGFKNDGIDSAFFDVTLFPYIARD